MRELNYDAVVVGAGPAGSIAAKTLAENGVKTLFGEEAGDRRPKRCAEAIDIKGLNRVGLEPDPRWAVQKINGAALYSPAGKVLKLSVGANSGYILERKMFEKYLAAEAINRGARYMVKTSAHGVLKDGDRVVGVSADHMGEEYRISARLVIAADGVDSMTAKSAGFETQNRLTDYHSCFQYEMAGIRIEDRDCLHIFFGDDTAPKGYAWIFPKGGTVANVGLGVLSRLSEPGKNARHYLNHFIAQRPEIFANASPIEINSGGVPVGSSIKSLVSDGFMIVGDAGHQVNPVHGGGLSMGMYAAKIAGTIGAKAIAEGNVSRERLIEYEETWHSGDGAKAQRLLKLRAFLEKLTAEDLDTLADVLNGDDIIKLTEGDYRFLLKKFIKNAPTILPLAKKFLA